MPFTFDNPNTFANNPLDRASEKRADSGWIARRYQEPSTLVIPFWKLKPLAIKGRDGKPEAGFMRPGLFESLMAEDAPLIFLGQDKDGAYFAADISAAPDPESKGPLAGLGTFEDLRGLAQQISAGDAAILGQARSILDWHHTHKFCSNCGAPSTLSDGGYKRECGVCKTEHFPRVNPVAIMLATLGDRCLVGRGRAFPKGMFSALAGFIEPGETIEEAVARELFEEAGCRVKSVTYHSNQPWPWPSQMMIGCFAEAESDEINIDQNEIAEARWVDRATMRAALAGTGPEGFWVPPKFAIAHQLIKAWAEQD
jgi:NAD+ diphosphatase